MFLYSPVFTPASFYDFFFAIVGHRQRRSLYPVRFA
jgi:hypothetical protein